MTLSTSSNFGVWSLMLNASEVKNSKREEKNDTSDFTLH
jgi:hypothetical protein